ncbi:MAG: thiol peroxidase [Verrucomicrobia bacterium]|nr:thiol peroxidase [Verrucomicrobiota bacterium]MBS0636935.1 thiol peroxidase [Verrucomicrobiota bacterium]
MATVTLKGNEIHTNGTLPKIGSKAPDFLLTSTDLKDMRLSDFKGKRKLISIVPSLDTGVCALSARKLNEEAKKNPNAAIIFVSADLPFAQKRVTEADGLSNIIPLSMIRTKDFARDYGILITDGPLAGVAARSIVVVDENDNVIYTELVGEITSEPNYLKAIDALK